MIAFKLNGKKVSIPSTWDDVSMSNYLSILNNEVKDTIEMIGLFTGISQGTLKKATIIGLDDLIRTLSFLNKVPEFNGKPDKVGTYKLPANIQFESLAQFEDMRAIIKDCRDIKSVTNAYPKMVAIYLQKVRDKEYDYSKAMQMTEVMDMPAKEVITVGAFFYVKLTSLLRGTQTTSPPTTQSPKKSKQGLRSSAKRSARR